MEIQNIHGRKIIWSTLGVLSVSVSGRGSSALQIIISVLRQCWVLQAVLGVRVLGAVGQFWHMSMADLDQ